MGNGEEREVENGEDRQGYRKRYEYDKSNITYYYLQTFLEVGILECNARRRMLPGPG